MEGLRRDIGDLFQVYDTTLGYPEPDFVRFRGKFLADPAECFDELRRVFEQHGYTPLIREEDGRTSLIALPGIFNPSEPARWVNLVLLIATIFSTLLVGTLYSVDSTSEVWQIWRGWPFALSIMLILGTHEMGHYVAARYHKVPVTLPYFIPMPLSIIGTLGAFIRLQAPVKNKRALLDVGAAGPIAGLIVALPLLVFGLYTSNTGPIATGALLEGNSLLYAMTKVAIFGQILPTNGIDVQLNQVAWAAWVGLLVTGINLIPLGQLDGGHIAYALWGEKARALFWPVIAALLLVTSYSFLMGTPTYTWLLWVGLLMFFGRNYAQPLDDITVLDSRRRILAIVALCLFLAVFVPLPLTNAI